MVESLTTAVAEVAAEVSAESYAGMMVTRTAARIVAACVLVVVCVTAMRNATGEYDNIPYGSPYDEMVVIKMVACVLLMVFGLLVVCMSAADLIGWLTWPKEMFAYLTIGG